jgi:hypothetical protein
MSDDQVTLRSVSWRDCCPWLIIFRTVGLAISMQVLFLATVGVLANTAGWRISEYLFVSQKDKIEDPGLRLTAHYYSQWPGDRPVAPEPPCPIMTSPPTMPVRIENMPHNPVSAVYFVFVEPFRRLFDPLLPIRHAAYFLFGGLWTVLIWAVFGGAIARTAMVQLGREERVGLGEALAHARGKFLSYFGAPLLPLLGVAACGLLLALFGLCLRVPAIGPILGILWALCLVLGLVMGLLLLGLAVGWPLMWGTIAAEGSDAFDALSRSYSYSFQRPLKYAGYFLLVVFLALAGWLLVGLFAEAVVAVTWWGVAWGYGGQNVAALQAIIDGTVAVGTPSDRLWTDSAFVRFGAWSIAFWISLVRTVASAFAFALLWSASAAMYLLLRRDVDQMEIDEVQVEEQEESYGLPPLKNDEAGVPGVADVPGSGNGPRAAPPRDSSPAE